MLKSPTTQWCVTSRERVNNKIPFTFTETFYGNCNVLMIHKQVKFHIKINNKTRHRK